MNIFRPLLKAKQKPNADEKSAQLRAAVDDIQEDKRRLENLLEPTGFTLGDAVMGREEEESWTPTTSG